MTGSSLIFLPSFNADEIIRMMVGRELGALYEKPQALVAAEGAAALTWIGEVAEGSGLVLLGPDGPVEGLRGYEHG